MGFPSRSAVKNPPARQEMQVRFLAWEDLLKKGMATHTSILVWRIPRAEGPGGLQSMRSQRVRHDRAAKHACTHAIMAWYFWSPVSIQQLTRGHFIRIKDTLIIQETKRFQEPCVRNSGQRPYIKSTVITQGIRGVFEALCQKPGAENNIHFL